MTVPQVRSIRESGNRLVAVTAYDYTSARIADAAGLDILLVGDSLGMVVQGHANSLPVSLGEMVYHTRCVARGASRSLIVADLPFLSYQVSLGQAVRSSGKLLKAGAQAVKLEGGRRMAAAVEACTRADIPVMGHIGLTPQSVHRMGGFKVQRDVTALIDDAIALEEAGAFSIVIEGVPSDAAKQVRDRISIPTIGIGAGPHCDGQVLVWHDLLGLYDKMRPKFVKRYAELGDAARQALATYASEVRDGSFPTESHGFR